MFRSASCDEAQEGACIVDVCYGKWFLEFTVDLEELGWLG